MFYDAFIKVVENFSIPSKDEHYSRNNSNIDIGTDWTSANKLVKISHGKDTLHSMISGFYSSKPEWTNGLTVRQWLSTQSYEDQWKFGLQKLTEFAKEIGAKIEFVE